MISLIEFNNKKMNNKIILITYYCLNSPRNFTAFKTRYSTLKSHLALSEKDREAGDESLN